MESKTRKALEKKYRKKGSAKIRKGEFQLQDLQSRQRFNIDLQPWNFIMRPGKTRHMSVEFDDVSSEQLTCPHCKSNNEASEDQPITW